MGRRAELGCLEASGTTHFAAPERSVFWKVEVLCTKSVAYAIQAPTMVEAMAACRGRQWCERPVNQIIARPMGLNHAAEAAENAHPICRVRTGQLMLGARDWRQGKVVRRT